MIINLNDSGEQINSKAKSTILQGLEILSPDVDPLLSESILDSITKSELSKIDSLPNASIDLCDIEIQKEISIPKTDVCDLQNPILKKQSDIKQELLASGVDLDNILYNLTEEPKQDPCVDSYINDLKTLSNNLYKESLKLQDYYKILNDNFDHFIKIQFPILLKSYFLIFLSKSENKNDILIRIKSKIKDYFTEDPNSEYSDNNEFYNFYSNILNLISEYSEFYIDPTKKGSIIVDIQAFLGKNTALNRKHNNFLSDIDSNIFDLNIDYNNFKIDFKNNQSNTFNTFLNVGFRGPDQDSALNIEKFFLDNRTIRADSIRNLDINSYSEFLKSNIKDFVEFFNTLISYKISDTSIYTDIENSLYEDLENSNINFKKISNALESINNIQNPEYAKKQILNIKKCGETIQIPITEDIDIKEDISKQGESSYSQSDITRISYWRQYAKYLTLTSTALPNTWSVGLILPNGTRVPLPTIYIAVVAFYFAPVLTVVFITINGIVILPTIYQIHQIPLDEARSLILFGTKGSNITIRQKKTGNEILNLPVIKGVNIDPISSLILPFKKDDLPILERMSLRNIVFLNYLRMWITNISSYMGL